MKGLSKRKIALNTKTKAKQLLQETKDCPGMYALTKDSLLNRICTILEMAECNFNVSDFYQSHLKINGSTYIDALEQPNDIWSNETITHALQILNENS